MKEKDFAIGYKFKPKRSRSIFEVVSIFTDKDTTYYVAKKETNWGGTEYAHIFYFMDGELIGHI